MREITTMESGDKKPEWKRAGLRRAALMHDLAFAYDLGQYEVEGASSSPGKKQIPRPDSTDQVKLTKKQKNLLRRWNLHEPLIDDAVDGYIRFRKSIEDVAQLHASVLILWASRLNTVEEAAEWLALERKRPTDHEFGALKKALQNLREVLVDWRLTPKTGDAPLVNPFGVAVALGLDEAKTRYGNGKLLKLHVVDRLANRTFLEGLAYGKLLDRCGDPVPPEPLERLRLEFKGPGQGRIGQYQLQDAQWWVLRYIGGVELMKVARTAGITYQQMQRSFGDTERALGLMRSWI